MSEIVKQVTVAVPMDRVWAALTDPETISEWMGDAVQVDLKIGGAYAFFSGETTGAFVRIEPPNHLDYTWRQSTWQPDWAESLVSWQLSAAGASTRIELTHSHFPNDEERDSHDEGWDVYWLEPMIDFLETESDG